MVSIGKARTSMASPHVAGAMALLASVSKPVDEAGVFSLYNQVTNAGNLSWTDDSGDGIKEPLLDVSNEALFEPLLISTGQIGLSVTVTGTKTKYANLTWGGATSENVDIYRSNELIATMANDGTYRDGPLPKTGSRMATYMVCEAGTTMCSNLVTVTW